MLRVRECRGTYRWGGTYTYPLTVTYTVSYVYDGYSCQGTCDPGDYCRDSEFENLRVEDPQVIDVKKVLESILADTTHPPRIPDHLVKYATDVLKMDEVDTYEAVAVGGYYGQEAEVQLASEAFIRENLTKYIEKTIGDDVFMYLESKGHKFTISKGSAAELVRTLNAENGKIMRLPKKKAEIKKLPLTSIEIPNEKHFAEVKPKKIPMVQQPIHGVVVVRGDKYKLVDGYGRMKALTANRKRKNGTFIVLS